MANENKEKCFIITPIGEDNDPIRRHIDGIIDAAIKPALSDKYEVQAAHHISKPGSITKQVIEAIYNAKLVVANLTGRNPNVMYELALRHAIGKPVIMIVERGTPVPSDIIMQRVVLYSNDAKGVLELRDDLKKAESEISFDEKSGPIVEVLGDISHDADILQKVAAKNSDSTEPLEYIMRRLDRIENSITLSAPHNEPQTQEFMFHFLYENYSGVDFDDVDWMKIYEISNTYPNATVQATHQSGNCSDGGLIDINLEVEQPRPNAYALSGWLVRCLSDIGFNNVKYTGNTKIS